MNAAAGGTTPGPPASFLFRLRFELLALPLKLFERRKSSGSSASAATSLFKQNTGLAVTAGESSVALSQSSYSPLANPRSRLEPDRGSGCVVTGEEDLEHAVHGKQTGKAFGDVAVAS